MPKLIASKDGIEKIRARLPDALKHELDDMQPLTEDGLKALWDSKEPIYGSLLDTFWNEPDTVQAAVNLSHHMKQTMDNLFNGGAMSNQQKPVTQYDASQFYREKTFTLKRNDGFVLFDVTVTEISREKKAELQAEMFSHVDMDLSGTSKKSMQQETQKRISKAMKEIKATEFTDRGTVLGIKSWTWANADGSLVPVCFEAFRALPEWATDVIEKEVEALNPELDEEFQD